MGNPDSPDAVALAADHEPEAIRRRLARRPPGDHLGDAVLGGIDGCVTTFAVVGAAAGAGFPARVSLVVGLANLLADGFSMAVSNYESIKAHNEFIDATRREEERHIEQVPEGEREEIRQIFAKKGFADDVLERIVATITADRKLWVDTMLAEEHGLRSPHPSPIKSGAVTFAAFVAIGLIPLLPLSIPALAMPMQIYVSVALAGAVFFAIGSLKSLFFGRPAIKAGFATLLTGGSAAGLAFAVGYLLRAALGV